MKNKKFQLRRGTAKQKKNAGNGTSNGGIRSSYSSELHHTNVNWALHSKEYNICQFTLIPRGIKTHTL